MKKLLLLALTSAMVMTMASCTKGESATSETKDSAQASVAANGEWAPTDTVRMIVSYKAGSGTDTTARVLSEYAMENIGQTVVIDNLEGGSGSIGWTALAQADPDGYTLGFANLPTICSNIVNELGDYTMDDFVPICNHVSETAVVLVAADSEFNTLQDLVAYAQANPGKLKASTNGTKSSNHIGAQLLSSSANFKYKFIPYGGTADQLLALRQHEVDFSVAKIADFASFKSEVKILGIFNPERIAEYPEVPTLGELGYYDQWYGSARCIVAPKGTPANIVKFYENAFKNAMEDPQYLAAAEKASVTTNYLDAADTEALLKSQYTFCTDTVASLDWDD